MTTRHHHTPFHCNFQTDRALLHAFDLFAQLLAAFSLIGEFLLRLGETTFCFREFGRHFVESVVELMYVH